jgi:dolichol kinase
VIYARGVSREIIEALLAGALSIAVIIEVARRASPGARHTFLRVFGALLRDRERTALTGATWLLAACLAAVVLLPRDAAVATLWCAAAGDPAATLGGRAISAPCGTQPGARKTLAGSGACLATSLIGTWRLAHFSVGAAAVIAIAVTLAEHATVPLDDNLRIAVAAGAATWLLS